MNVYVETNFLLEQALEQEQSDSCEGLIELAMEGRIRLILPAFSVAESHISFMRKQSDRNRIINELQKQLTEMGRSKPFRSASETFRGIASLVVDSTDRERKHLQDRTEALLKVTEIVPLDADMLWRAAGIQLAFDLSFQDAVVLASVQFHIMQTTPEHSCFLNRNAKDFDDPYVRGSLDRLDCKFFSRFDHGLGYILDPR